MNPTKQGLKHWFVDGLVPFSIEVLAHESNKTRIETLVVFEEKEPTPTVLAHESNKTRIETQAGPR